MTKRAKKKAKKTSKRKTHKSLGSAMRAVKRKATPRRKEKLAKATFHIEATGGDRRGFGGPLDVRKGEDLADAMRRHLGPEIERPRGFKPRPANTRWPNEIKVGKRHRKDFGDLKGLAKSIDARGALLQPIPINPENVLVAGERRLKAWPLSKFKNQPIPIHVITPDSIIAGEWDENAQRKDFTPSEAVAIKKEIERQLSALAKQRQRSGKAVDPKEKGRAGDHASRAAGLARRSIEKAQKVVEAAEKDPVRFGKLQADMDRTGRVNGPFKRLQVMQQTEALRKAPPPLPMRGPYMTMVVDFPVTGDIDKDQETIDATGRSFRGYPEMSIEGCCTFARKQLLPILAPDCSVWLTFPNYHIVKGASHKIIAAFGDDFDAVTMLTWKKDKPGRGAILRDETEHAIVIYRGKPTFNVLGEEPPTTFLEAVRRENSRKPDELYARIERICPAPRYAEIFSRGGRNEKWDCHGDEVGKFAPAVPKDKQVEILAPITKTYDELKLATLEAIERGETPDLRLLDKKLVAEIDRLVEGKKKLKLSRSGERVLANIREDADYARLLAELPNDAVALEDEYRKAIVDQHAMLTASQSLDLAAAQGIARRIDVILNKVENGGKDRLYGRLSWSKKVEKLTRGFAAPVGQVPMWGQAGLFQVDVDGLPVLVLADHDGNFEVFALDHGRLFLDKSGSDNLSNVTLDTEWGDHKDIFGKTVDQHVLEELRSDIKSRTPPKKGKPKLHQRLLALPEKVYALPAEWDGKSEPRPVKAKAPQKPGKPTPPPKAPAKTPRRTLPGRDAQLIAFAEHCGHVVSMTIDHVDASTSFHVATCACGWSDKVQRGLGGDKKLDAAVTAHWREAQKQAGISDDDLSLWLELVAVQAGKVDEAAVDLITKKLIDKTRVGRPFKLTAIGERTLQDLDRKLQSALSYAQGSFVRPTADGPAAGPDEGSKAAAAAAPLAGVSDDGQLEIPGCLDRRDERTTSLTNPKLMPAAKEVKAIADRAQGVAK